jgi:hypothetical protein
MKGDLSVLGLQFSRERRVAASATRFEAGEPLYSKGTYTTGVASDNTWVLAAEDFPILGTHTLGGIAIKGAKPYKTGTLVAQTAVCACPVPHAGLIRGKVETAASIDTAAELLGFINDTVTFDYSATGGTDGGELYTVKTASDTPADTGALAIIDGNISKGTLDVEVYATVYRLAQDVTA